MSWIVITKQLPPFDKEVIFKGLLDWRTDGRIQIFNDKLTTEEEDLDYGQKAYLLHNHTDFLVSQNPEINTLCSEFITHWMKIPEETPNSVLDGEINYDNNTLIGIIVNKLMQMNVEFDDFVFRFGTYNYDKNKTNLNKSVEASITKAMLKKISGTYWIATIRFN